MSLINILRQLKALGHNVSLATVQDPKKPHIQESQIKIISPPLNTIPLILPAMFTIILWFYLPILVITSKIDIIIMEPSVHIVSSFPLFVMAKLKKLKLVLDIRSTPVEIKGLSGSFFKFWFGVSVLVAKKRFDGITIITPQMKQKICDDFEVNPEKVGTWTSGVSTSLFNPQNFISEGHELRNKLGLSSRFIVFYHGVFTPTRGLAETIGAIEILVPRYPELVFFLLGDGPFAPSLRSMITSKHLEGHVVIANPVNQVEVPKFISMSDVTIVPLPDHPYWRFQSPLKLLEYLSMQKVVIATDIPAHHAVLGDAKCGIYISSIKPQEIANGIENAYLNKSSLEERGKIGREIIEKSYSWEKVAAELENFLVSLG